jgi:hypothetical protein
LRAFQATYEGPGKAIVTVQEMRPGLAFEAAQHWHATANSVCFDKDLYFVTVEWQQVDRTALRAFVRDIENAIGDRP